MKKVAELLFVGGRVSAVSDNQRKILGKNMW